MQLGEPTYDRIRKEIEDWFPHTYYGDTLWVTGCVEALDEDEINELYEYADGINPDLAVQFCEDKGYPTEVDGVEFSSDEFVTAMDILSEIIDKELDSYGL